MMKNPAHPGQLISENLAELGLSISEAARGLDITRQQLHNIISGRSAVTPEMALKLERAMGGTADTWLRMQANYDLAQLRERGIPTKVKRFTRKVA